MTSDYSLFASGLGDGEKENVQERSDILFINMQVYADQLQIS